MGHDEEIVCLSFEPQLHVLATGSMDKTCKLWDLEQGKMLMDLAGHQGEIISLSFTTEGDRVLTGSFDGTAKIWDLRSGICV